MPLKRERGHFLDILSISIWLFVLLALAAFAQGCAHESKSVADVQQDKQQTVVTESVTTAPTKRVTERWHFTVTPGIGRALPAGSETARNTPSAGSSPAGFQPSPGLGYMPDEYERITEDLAPVAITRTTVSTLDKLRAKITQYTKWETAIPILRIAVGLALLAALAWFLLRRFFF